MRSIGIGVCMVKKDTYYNSSVMIRSDSRGDLIQEL